MYKCHPGAKPGSVSRTDGHRLGKTVTFANIPRQGRTLILSHREELVRQPLKYFDCPCGIEQGANHASPADEVVSASVQSLARRLDRFSPGEFDLIITDEAHHAAAKSYRRIFDHFQPRLHLGFTATPDVATRSVWTMSTRISSFSGTSDGESKTIIFRISSVGG